MSGRNVEHRAAKVSLVMGASTVLSMVFQLVSVPVCLEFWGAQGYGAWLAIYAAATLLRTVDGGYITFAGNRLNLLYHRDQHALRRVLAAGSLGIVALGVLQLALLGLAMAFGGLGWLLGDTQLANDSSARAALVVLAVSWVLSGSYLGLVHRLMVPAGMLYQSAWWSMAFQSLVFIAIMLAASLRLNLLGTSVLVAGVQVSIYIASADYMRRKLPQFFPWWSAPEWRLAASDLRSSLTFTFSGLIQQATTNGLVLVISSVLGAAAVPAFTTVRTLANLWTNITNTLTSPLLADMVRFHAHHRADKLLMLGRAHSWLLGLLVNLSVLASLPFVGWVFRRWTHDEVPLDAGLLAGLLGTVLLTNSGSFMTSYLAGINNTRAVLMLALVRGVVSIAIACALLPKLGLTGVGIGLLVAETTCLVTMAVHYFPRSVNGAGLVAPSSVIGWSLLGLVATLVLVFSSAVIGYVPAHSLVAAMGVVVVSSWLGWRSLDTEVRRRLLSLGTRLVGCGGRS